MIGPPADVPHRTEEIVGLDASDVLAMTALVALNAAAIALYRRQGMTIRRTMHVTVVQRA